MTNEPTVDLASERDEAEQELIGRLKDVAARWVSSDSPCTRDAYRRWMRVEIGEIGLRRLQWELGWGDADCLEVVEDEILRILGQDPELLEPYMAPGYHSGKVRRSTMWGRSNG